MCIRDRVNACDLYDSAASPEGELDKYEEGGAQRANL